MCSNYICNTQDGRNCRAYVEANIDEMICFIRHWRKNGMSNLKGKPFKCSMIFIVFYQENFLLRCKLYILKAKDTWFEDSFRKENCLALLLRNPPCSGEKKTTQNLFVCSIVVFFRNKCNSGMEKLGKEREGGRNLCMIWYYFTFMVWKMVLHSLPFCLV